MLGLVGFDRGFGVRPETSVGGAGIGRRTGTAELEQGILQGDDCRPGRSDLQDWRSAPSVTMSTELTGPSLKPDRSATPAEASTVTLWTPSLNVTVAPVASPSMPDAVNDTAPFSALLIELSLIDSARSPPASAVVSRVIVAPLADAVLPAPSVTLSCELTGPSLKPVRSATPAEALTVTLWTPSLNVTVALVTSPSMPDAVNATAPFSALLIEGSLIDSARSPPLSAVVSRVIAAPLADAVLPVARSASDANVPPQRPQAPTMCRTDHAVTGQSMLGLVGFDRGFGVRPETSVGGAGIGRRTGTAERRAGHSAGR